MELSEIREKIDAVDEQLLDLFLQRMERPLVPAVGTGKCAAFPGGTIHLIDSEKGLHPAAVPI